MIESFENWTINSNIVETGSFDTLSNTVIGIEAADYLNRLPKYPIPNVSRPIKEALLPAMGGEPFGLKDAIQKTIKVWRDKNITPMFVFSGLAVGKQDQSAFAQAETSMQANSAAWTMYDSNRPQQAVEAFGNSDAVTAEDLFRCLQRILRGEGVSFQVAPYSAWGQLAYLYKCKAVDTIAASSETLLFDVPEIITNWDFRTAEFQWVRRRACIDSLSVAPEIFVDACMLAGSAFLPSLPLLDTRKPKIRAAIDSIRAYGGSGDAVCLHYQDDSQMKATKYLDRYRQARLAVKHHVVLTQNGKVEPFDIENAPGDIEEFVGHRLPEELYFYLSRGIISPQVLNRRTSGYIYELPPLDNGESEQYKILVRDQLSEVKITAVSLITRSLHRVYEHRNLQLKCWFNKDNIKVINVRELDDPRPMIADWNVDEDIYGPALNKALNEKSALLGIAIKTLRDPSFPRVSITKKQEGKRLLRKKDEILFNTIWRLLRIRGYVDEKHELTTWGTVLLTVLSKVPNHQWGEAAFIAVELARLGLLNANDMFPQYTGGPYLGNAAAKRFTRLISRVATLGKLHHQDIGYTGPLSRDLLGFNSMVSATRIGIRDLAEVCLTTLLLNGDADRDRDDWYALGLDLPFLESHATALGIAVAAYLGDMASHYSPPGPGDATPPTPTANIKSNAKNHWRDIFQYSTDFEGDIELAFQFWDALYAGFQKAGSEFKQFEDWKEANAWLRFVR